MGRRWVVPLLIGWSVVVVAGAFVAVRLGSPTAREQTSVADATPTVERAVTDLVVAAGPAVAIVGPYVRTGTCRITAARRGQRWERVVGLYTPAGAEPALLDKLARDLPRGYRAYTRRGESGAAHTLRADAGDFVGLSGGVTGVGEVRLTVATGCRSLAASRSAPATALDVAPVSAALTALRVTATTWRHDELRCADGGSMRIAEASGDRGVEAPLPAVLATVGPGPVVAQPEIYGYRAGDVSVVARLAGGRVTVTATAPCD